MQPDIYLAGSTDSGQSWPGALTELVSDLASQSDERSDYPSLFVARASNDDIAHIVWDDRRNWTELTDSIDNPPTSSPDVAGAPEVYHQNIIR